MMPEQMSVDLETLKSEPTSYNPRLVRGSNMKGKITKLLPSKEENLTWS
jgi:hypothetical protein